ncbi:hypothetical protein Pelo_5488 [Pelomyxa schiedti]|nr:hypothetical protein Pelo_5488 [Pelomyxa schiedti]
MTKRCHTANNTTTNTRSVRSVPTVENWLGDPEIDSESPEPDTLCVDSDSDPSATLLVLVVASELVSTMDSPESDASNTLLEWEAELEVELELELELVRPSTRSSMIQCPRPQAGQCSAHRRCLCKATVVVNYLHLAIGPSMPVYERNESSLLSNSATIHRNNNIRCVVISIHRDHITGTSVISEAGIHGNVAFITNPGFETLVWATVIVTVIITNPITYLCIQAFKVAISLKGVITVTIIPFTIVIVIVTSRIVTVPVTVFVPHSNRVTFWCTVEALSTGTFQVTVTVL